MTLKQAEDQIKHLNELIKIQQQTIDGLIAREITSPLPIVVNPNIITLPIHTTPQWPYVITCENNVLCDASGSITYIANGTF